MCLLISSLPPASWAHNAPLPVEDFHMAPGSACGLRPEVRVHRLGTLEADAGTVTDAPQLSGPLGVVAARAAGEVPHRGSVTHRRHPVSAQRSRGGGRRPGTGTARAPACRARARRPTSGLCWSCHSFASPLIPTALPWPGRPRGRSCSSCEPCRVPEASCGPSPRARPPRRWARAEAGP